MKLFYVEIGPGEYDTYDSAVIACETKDILTGVLENELNGSGQHNHLNKGKILFNQDFYLSKWNSQKVKAIKCIGEYTGPNIPVGVKAVVICSSYNAG